MTISEAAYCILSATLSPNPREIIGRGRQKVKRRDLSYAAILLTTDFIDHQSGAIIFRRNLTPANHGGLHSYQIYERIQLPFVLPVDGADRIKR